MIIDQLMLHNVGTFAGRNTLQLTPPSSNKPIVLIGGLNGAGKTTLLEAINLALYGPLTQTAARKSGGYENYLRGLIHKGVPESEGAAIELTFHAHQEGNEREYWIRRSWRSTGASIREILLVSVDGRHDEALTSTWSEHIESFLPRGIAGLFFFDGEQIEALADLDRSQEVLSSALASLMGLELVDRLSTDLAVLRKRHQNSQVPDKLCASIDERQEAVTAARRAEELAANQVARLRVAVERAEKALFELNERYRSAGGNLVDHRESAERSAQALRAEVTRIEDLIRHEMAESAPLLQLAKVLKEMSGQVDAESDAQRNRVITDVLACRDREITALLARASVPKEVLAQVDEFMASDRGARAAAAVAQNIVGVSDAAGLRHLMSSTLPNAEKRLRELVEMHTSTKDKHEQAERVLVAIPDDEALGSLVTDREEASADLIRRRAALTHAEEKLKFSREDRARADAAYEAALEAVARANLAADDNRRLVDHLDRVRATLQDFRLSASRRHLGRISELVLDALGRLLRKENLITDVAVDAKTHAVELTGRDGLPLSPANLSAGERQLLAVALLWGLARAAGQPLPVVIDTPLGRLDGSHREHLLERYFPHASHQVLLLSTDTEIDAEAYTRVAKYVGREYRLVFDQTTNATSVMSGYFWE
ncbi:DNA sulfur modification protein DndD [Mycobacterium parascrofulaceum ATCC BAA-614]|uniref:Nuclease SbcCD subunit C n=1 Tax=Mycobacterium parascrofulaceum ATCC BAA-614 TaxID=525368 RepID=D5P7E1_9MYCO|nr:MULTISPECIES: DNA sulfur modification protein DndD [Mycobacterium]EFG78016.1 DNA sulfur modification protein DndD [Mycobacterium parascrofulaceum ATCC BAA-614]OCB40715.1 DNA sulfur modification protein DndD [Mycobacterium malmoense]